MQTESSRFVPSEGVNLAVAGHASGVALLAGEVPRASWGDFAGVDPAIQGQETTIGQLIADAGSRRLGRSVKSDDARARRAFRFRLQDEARRLLPEASVARCLRARAVYRDAETGRMCEASDVRVVRTTTNDGSHVGLHGLQTCQSVWTCPICSARASEARRAELNQLLAWGRERGFVPVLLTLTVRHGAGDDLRSVLDALKLAKRRMHQSRAWRSLPVVGHVTATEVTHGVHGWHPHLHVVVLLRASGALEAVSLLEGCRDVWLAQLRRLGFDCNEHGFRVDPADRVGSYVAKWGAAEELTLVGSKRGRGSSGRTPWQLLAASADGDRSAGRLFQHFAEVFAGRRQLVWSAGLKDQVGLDDAEDIPADDLAPPLEVLAVVPRGVWIRVCSDGQRADLLAAGEAGGADGVRAFIALVEARIAALARHRAHSRTMRAGPS